MKIEKKELPKKQIEFTIEISADELKPFLEKTAEEISKSKNIAGFRPGKAPYDIVVKEVGEMTIYQTAANSAIEKYYFEAVTKENIEPVDQPSVEVVKLAPGNDFIFKATVATMPVIEVADLEKINVKPVEKEEVTEDEVTKTIDRLLKMRAKETLEEKAAETGNKVEMSFKSYMDNVPLEGGSSEKHSVVIGEGMMIPGFEENIVGLKKDEEKEFELEFPKEYHEKKLAGKKATFKVKVSGVYRIEVPELNEEIAVGFGFKDVEGLKGNIKHNIEHEKEQKATQRKEIEIVEALIEKSKIDEIPETMIDSEVHKMMHEMEENVAKQGMKMEDYLTNIKKTESDLKLDFVPDAIKRVKTGLIIRQIAIDNKIEATPEDIKAEKDKTIAQYKMNPATAEQVPELEKQLESENATRYFENLIANRKTIEFIKGKVIAG